MEITNEFINLYLPTWILLVAGFSMAFIISFVSIPPIVDLARTKGFYAMPNGRTSHFNATPYLGGVAVFTGLILTTVVIAGSGFMHDLIYIIAGLIIILFLGLKDDMLVINPYKKLAGQLIAAGLIVVLGDIRIDHFHGVLGLADIPYIASVFFTIFVFIVIVNGLNLIDGIDGLASGVGTLIAFTLGSWFWMAGVTPYAIMSFALAGSLTAFFCFNVFSKKNKIFLGDAGSLIVGFAIAIIAIQFLEYQTYALNFAAVEAAPAVAFGILIVPLYDTLRVFSLRISQGRSPFSADRQHLHHVLLDLGNTHLRATLILMGANLFIILVSILLQTIGYINLFTLQLLLATGSSYIAVWMLRKKRQREFFKGNYRSKQVEMYKSKEYVECADQKENSGNEKKKLLVFN
jgi:UDP-GlcNAc:undecaprenyl-phosphate GlcNAc-1-phosphate transferase